MNINYDAVEQARKVLRDNGYYADLLWHIDDVKSRYPNISDDEAYDILHGASHNDATNQQMWESISWEIIFHDEN